MNWATRISIAGMTCVAVTAAVISFRHVYSLAIEHGETSLAAALLPISIDGAITCCVVGIMGANRNNQRAGVMTWTLLVLALAASLGANIASAEPTLVGRLIAAWPPLAMGLGIEVVSAQIRQKQVPADESRSVHDPQPDTNLSQSTEIVEVQSRVSSTEVFLGMPARDMTAMTTGSHLDHTGRSEPTAVDEQNEKPAQVRTVRSVPPLADSDIPADARQVLDDAEKLGKLPTISQVRRSLGCGYERAKRARSQAAIRFLAKDEEKVA